MTHRFNPDHFAKLDDRERLEWQNPDALIEWLDLKDGETVVDIGAGTGYFAMPLAKRYPGVTIYAADISPKMLELLNDRATSQGLQNIRPMATDGRLLDLADGTADLVLMVNVLHEIVDDLSLVTEARRVAKTGGRLALVDWKKEETQAGPPVDERVDQTEAIALLVAEAEFYPYHYTVVLS